MIRFIFWNIITSLFAFGGGSTLLSYLYEIYVIKLSILSEVQFSQMSIFSNIVPGPVSITFISLVGYYINGIWGWLLGVLSFSIVTILYTSIFNKYINKLMWFKSISDYILPILYVSLLYVIFKTFTPLILLKYYNIATSIKLIFLTFTSILLIVFKVKRNYILGLNIFFSIIFLII